MSMTICKDRKKRGTTARTAAARVAVYVLFR